MSNKYEGFDCIEGRVEEHEGFMEVNGSKEFGVYTYITKQQAMDFFGLVEPNANALILRLCTGCKQEHPIDEMREWNNSRFVCVGCDEPIGGGG